MKFRSLQKLLLGDRAKARVLMHLLRGGPAASEREIARFLGVSHVAVNKSMRDFEMAGLVSAEKVGGSKVWRVKRGSFACEKLSGLAALADPYESLRGLIANRLESWGDAIEFARIYGPVGERKEEAGSDIDVLVVLKRWARPEVPDERVKERVGEALRELSEETLLRYGNAINAVVLMEGEKEGMRELVERARNGMHVMP